jgi:site-specific DNA-adenine methylase
MSKFLKPPISYQGGKSRELKYIDEYKPDHFTKFIDVFGGGGAVFLHFLQKYPDLVEVVYNDIDTEMVELFTILKSEERTNELCEWLKSQKYEESEWRSRVEPCLKNRNDIREMLYIKGMSYRCMIGSKVMNMRTNKDGVLVPEVRANYSHFNKYPSILSTDKFKITQMNGLDVIEQYKDDPDAFLYLDPPYVSCDTSTYKAFSRNDIFKLLDILKYPSYKCKIMLHIEFLGYTYHELKDQMLIYYPKRYDLSSKKNGEHIYQKYIMIATNYKKM